VGVVGDGFRCWHCSALLRHRHVTLSPLRCSAAASFHVQLALHSVTFDRLVRVTDGGLESLKTSVNLTAVSEKNLASENCPLRTSSLELQPCLLCYCRLYYPVKDLCVSY